MAEEQTNGKYERRGLMLYSVVEQRDIRGISSAFLPNCLLIFHKTLPKVGF